MLKQRLTTAVLAVVILGVVLFVLPVSAATLVIALLLIVAAWEWSGFLELRSTGLRYLYVALLGAVMAGVFWLTRDPNWQILLVRLACIWWGIAFVWAFFFPTPIPKALRWICGALVIAPLAYILPALLVTGSEILVFVLLVVWAADIGAYFAGKQFGRVKLAPQISPGKTWEGVIGGLLVVAMLALVGAWYFDKDWLPLLSFCLGVAAISIVGDLTVSMFKRTAGVKDSGSLFPGHGGVLDRVDSISAATPVFMLGAPWVGML